LTRSKSKPVAFALGDVKPESVGIVPVFHGVDVTDCLRLGTSGRPVALEERMVFTGPESCGSNIDSAAEARIEARL
jgi:hypothetical protein